MWEIITENRFTEDNCRYTAYGIRCGSCVISDICIDKEEIQEFVDTLNRLNVSPVHAADVVEDYLAAK